MKLNIDFSFIIAILVLAQLFLLSLNVSSKDDEETDEGDKNKDEIPYAKENNRAYIFESEGNEIKEKMLA
jgi:hypothetical protein